jgi:hypothetical protein
VEPDVEPDKGERHGGGGTAGPRVAHPADAGSGPAGVEALLGAAMRARADDTEAEKRAVAAFRAARDDGAHTARTRRRDDWRPGEQRRPSRSTRVAFAVLLAGLTLGGVAFAAVGPSSHDDDGHRAGAGARPSGSVPDRFSVEAAPPVGPGAPGVSTPGGSVATDPAGRPARARDNEAHCRAYASARGRGDAMDARAWRRLVAAAGGEREVEAYCAGQLAAHDGAKAAKGTRGTGKPGTAAGTPVPGAPAVTPEATKSKNER